MRFLLLFFCWVRMGYWKQGEENCREKSGRNAEQTGRKVLRKGDTSYLQSCTLTALLSYFISTTACKLEKELSFPLYRRVKRTGLKASKAGA